MKKSVKWICIILCAALLLTVLYFAFAFFGNPVSWTIARINASRFMEDNYGDSHFKVSNVGYNFKTGGYYAHVDSPVSQDSYFTIYFDGWGRYKYDSRENIANGNNTYERLYGDYMDLTNPVLDTMPFDVSIAFGDLRCADLYEVFTYTDENGQKVEYTIFKQYGLVRSELEMDKEYNIRQIGRDCGNICLYIHDPEVTVERTAELLLEVKAYLDQQQIPFHAIDFNLCEPRNEEGQMIGDQITLYDFLYDDIYAEGLIDRVQYHWDIAREHHAIQDAETEKLIKENAENQDNK